MSNLHLLIPCSKNSNSIQIAMELIKEEEEEEERCKVTLIASQKVDDIVSSKRDADDDEEERSKADFVASQKIDGIASSKMDENEDSDGYHTPTSPRHRIPKTKECPGAPKKPAPRRKRKRMACCSIAIVDVGLIFGVEMDGGERKRICNKSKEEATTDN